MTAAERSPRRPSPVRAVALAFSWLTVLPVPQPRFTIDRAAGGSAIAAAPVVGVVVGAATAGIAIGLAQTTLPTTAIGLLAVGFLALVTRGMHVDGLADTADGLGSMRPPEAAREIMRSGPVGPFGAATLVVVLALQAMLFGSLATDGRWGAIVVSVALGRVAVVVACRRSFPATGDGFGAIVGATQGLSAIVWVALAVVASATGDPDRWWRGPIVTVVVLLGVSVWTRHCTRRLGGVGGDVLGATVELTTVAALVGLAL
ncbi:adenosylcobinamide-GDP ribazoletransferase [Williamsia serinedens]|uniref:Adenosylcobinamide-GDP ribazoletransferase n=1 Tax=Williamsia serinedens TaxID=391736 RepID=A0ABT1H6L0_9NOCA|nr:adenosylcobinamide-GDP ribazoletransferase [Williamsia serinedens]MCP2162579.1 cobalamin-5'-phosphate synthase [Williamsia serinedens]